MVRFVLLVAGIVQPVLCAAFCTVGAMCGLCPPPAAGPAGGVAAAPSPAPAAVCEASCEEPAPASACGGCCESREPSNDESPPPCCPPASERGPFCVLCPDAGPWSLPERMPEIPKLAPLPGFAAVLDGHDASFRSAPLGSGRTTFLFSTASERRTVLCVWLN